MGVMAGDDDMQEDDEFGPWCPDIGQEHAWSEWEFSMVGSHECRFCSKCGGMETQEICTDPNCAGDHPHG